MKGKCCRWFEERGERRDQARSVEIRRDIYSKECGSCLVVSCREFFLYVLKKLVQAQIPIHEANGEISYLIYCTIRPFMTK